MSYDELLAQSKSHLRAERYKASERAATDAMLADRTRAEPLIYRASARRLMRQFDEAHKDLNEYIKRTKLTPHVLRVRCDIYEYSGDVSRALQTYGQALSLCGKDQKSLRLTLLEERASCLCRAKHYKEAADDFRTLLHLEPGQRRHLMAMASMLHSAGQIKAAIQELDAHSSWFGQDFGLKQLRRELEEDLAQQPFWKRLFGG
ncbi:MAG TPA: hypothetical protein VGB79_10040 [Allosphingosinicella sp.]